MSFKNPIFLILTVLVVLVVLLVKKLPRAKPGIQFPSHVLFRGVKDSLKLMLFKQLIFLRVVILSLIILALARPQSVLEELKSRSQGIDIVLALDCSTSMLAEDFKIGGQRRSRIDVVKGVISDFIKDRPNDRLSLVAFAGAAYTVCPLTLDHEWLLENLKRINTKMLEDGTAIGSGIIVSLERLKDSEAKSKVIILLTDGRNNAGKVSPLTAAEAASSLGVKIYTIGSGSKGLVPYPFNDLFGQTFYRSVRIDIDDKTLQRIANITAAKYFKATNTRVLKDIYQEINKLEKVEFVELGYQHYKELFTLFLIPAIVLLIAEIIFRQTVFRTTP